MKSQEKYTQSPEVKHDHEALEADEHRERLRKNLEHAGEKAHENVEDIAHEAMEKATSKEVLKEDQENAPERQPSPAERRMAPSTAEKDAAFNSYMNEAQTQMSSPSRTFSKFIHNKTVERISEVAGNTVARADAILSGAVCAFLLTLGVYLVAKNLGYPLSGFETIGAFVIGWILGLTYDFAKVMITGRK